VGEVLLAAETGEKLPLGLAFDADGNPTQDGSAAASDGVAAFGDHKGYGLAFGMQALGLLAGAAIPRGQVHDLGFFSWLSILGHCCWGTRSPNRCPNW
jgi:delta1-piperideine-2-carboxylate reductase